MTDRFTLAAVRQTRIDAITIQTNGSMEAYEQGLRALCSAAGFPIKSKAFEQLSQPIGGGE